MPKFPNLIKKKLKTKRATTEQRCCNHTSIEVDEATRMLQCKTCQKLIDPFDFLWRWANNQESVECRVDELRKEEKARWARITELKKEEKLIKARLKRLYQKDKTDG